MVRRGLMTGWFESNTLRQMSENRYVLKIYTPEGAPVKISSRVKYRSVKDARKAIKELGLERTGKNLWWIRMDKVNVTKYGKSIDKAIYNLFGTTYLMLSGWQVRIRKMQDTVRKDRNSRRG